MKTNFQVDNSGLPLGKLVGGVTILFVIITAGVYFYGIFSASQKAGEFYVLAKDEQRLEHWDNALGKINTALNIQEKPEYLGPFAKVERHWSNQVGGMAQCISSSAISNGKRFRSICRQSI